MTIRWIFDNDEHFLKSCGIEPYNDYETDCNILEQKRIKEFMSTMLNEFGTELSYFDEYPTEDPFGYDMSAHLDDGLPYMDEIDKAEEDNYKLEVMHQLSTAITEFLSFSTKADLLKFIDSQIN